MEVGNEIVIQSGTQWSFGNGVAQHFDGMLDNPFLYMMKDMTLFVI